MRHFLATADRIDDADVIDHRTDLRKQLADPQTTLTVRVELPGRPEQVARVGKLEIRLGKRDRLTAPATQLGFLVERINV